MKMASMKLPRISKKEANEKVMTSPDDREEFPYGLRLSLNEDQIKKLDGLFDMDVEGEVMLHAKARVVDKRSHEMKGGKTERSMEVQIMDLACQPAAGEKEEDNDSAWYDNMKKGK